MSEELHKSLLNGDDKLVTLANLAQYNHKIISALGLVQDTGAYKYKGDRTDFPEDEVKNVSQALDNLFDMAKSGAIQFNSGKAEDATLADIEFNSEDGEESNIYWINAKVGDDIVNIKLDADAFAKDSFLESVVLVTKETKEGAVEYKVNGQPVSEKPEGFDDEGGLSDGTYFHYTWKIDGGEKEASYEYTTISLKDIYGDLKGDEYITYDAEKAQIQAQVAPVKVTEETDEETGETSKVWTVDSDDETNLATAENLKEVATDLQAQIDKNEVDVADVTYDNTKTALTIDKTGDNTVIGLNLNVSYSSDIDALFSICTEGMSASEIKDLTPEAAKNATVSLSEAADVEEILSDDKTFKKITIA